VVTALTLRRKYWSLCTWYLI